MKLPFPIISILFSFCHVFVNLTLSVDKASHHVVKLLKFLQACSYVSKEHFFYRLIINVPSFFLSPHWNLNLKPPIIPPQPFTTWNLPYGQWWWERETWNYFSVTDEYNRYHILILKDVMKNQTPKSMASSVGQKHQCLNKGNQVTSTLEYGEIWLFSIDPRTKWLIKSTSNQIHKDHLHKDWESLPKINRLYLKVEDAYLPWFPEQGINT